MTLSARRLARRTILGAALGMLALAPVGTSVQAQEWAPEKGVEIIVGTSAGGSLDRMGRFAEQWLRSSGKAPSNTVLINKPGGGHAIAMNYIKDRAADPHYLLAVNTLMITNNLLGRSPIRFDEFTPIAVLYEEPMTFAVHADSDLHTAEDVVNRLKADPASLAISVSSGVGTANHVAVVKLAQAIGADVSAIKAVSFESGGDGITALLGKHVDIAVTPPEGMMQFVDDGQLRIIAVAGDTRGGGPLADIPTWRELGYDVSVSAWRGVVAPPGLAPEHIAYWESAFEEMIASDDFKATAESEFFTARYTDSAGSLKFFEELDEQFKAYLEAIGFEQPAAN